MEHIPLTFVKPAHSAVGARIGLIFEREDGGQFIVTLKRENAHYLLEKVEYALRASEPPEKK